MSLAHELRRAVVKYRERTPVVNQVTSACAVRCRSIPLNASERRGLTNQEARRSWPHSDRLIVPRKLQFANVQLFGHAFSHVFSLDIRRRKPPRPQPGIVTSTFIGTRHVGLQEKRTHNTHLGCPAELYDNYSVCVAMVRILGRLLSSL
jgi:hypothetical protein